MPKHRVAHATLTGRGQARATASGASELVRSLVDGEVAEPGAWMPEQVIDPSRFFDRLAHANVRVEFIGGTNRADAEIRGKNGRRPTTDR